MITRRGLFAMAGASWLLRPGRVLAAETLTVHYRQAPQHLAYQGLLAPGRDEFGPEPEMISAGAARGPRPERTRFADVTGSVLDSEPLRRGVPSWVASLDPACGIDIYGNQGIAVGDVDGDGDEEIYVCQPGGLPNRLFKWKDRRLVDITTVSGLDILDNTASALFLDLRNLGRQDVVLLRGDGPELFLNDGRGRFRHAPNAFRFASAPAGIFTGMAAADYNRDGRLDLYCCCYSFFQSEAQYRYPVPYHDAQNGPPNFLFRNRLAEDGSGGFEDVTAAVGLNENNNRFSFAPAWCDYDGSGWPSLYVANDFGRNNLYRNTDGRFRDVAAEAGVEDIGPGMSACWFDEDGDGWPDLYVSNMWSASGQWVVRSPQFHNAGTPELREAWRRHTKGNSLYRNAGQGKFEDVGAQQGVEMGRWAWSADARDFDLDGKPEIFITCGMLTGDRQPDLMSFFWRQVVAKSPVDSRSAAAYELGWNAINQYIREGYSWNGHEENVFYVRDGERYRDASRESGLDVAADSRAFAIADIDGDGYPDLLLKSRLGPQLRVFQNRAGSAARPRIGVQLHGTASNRDAVGARVEVDGQVQWVTAGSGYLSQHSRRLYFGLRDGAAAATIRIMWPSGEKQALENVEAGALYEIVEKGEIRRLREFLAPAQWETREVAGDNQPLARDTWLREPLPLPEPVVGAGLLVVHASEKPAVAGARYLDVRENPDRLAAFTLFRRYLFEHRIELTLPWALLLNAEGQVLKVYGDIPTAGAVARDRAAAGEGLPYPGRYLSSPRRDTFKLGAALVWSGYWEQALPYLEVELRRDPTNVRTLVLVAQVHREGNRLGEAERRLERALGADPASAEAWNEMGGVRAARGDHTGALDCYERALARKSDLGYALLNAAQAADKLQRLADAERYYRRAVAVEPRSVAAHNGLGLTLGKLERVAEAEAELQEAIRLEPGFASAWNNLGVLYVLNRRTGEAERTFLAGIEAAPDDEILYLNLGRTYLQTQRRDDAIALMKKLLARRPENEMAKKALRDLGAGGQ